MVTGCPASAPITATIIAITPTILGTTTIATGIATKRNFGAPSNGRPLLCAAAPAAILRASSRKMLKIYMGRWGFQRRRVGVSHEAFAVHPWRFRGCRLHRISSTGCP